MSEWEYRANHTQGRFRAVGGRLRLSGGLLEFRPHGFDKALAGRQWSAELARIRAVGAEPRTWNPLDGGLRERLRVELDDGSVELFVVNRLGEVRERIESAVTARDADDAP